MLFLVESYCDLQKKRNNRVIMYNSLSSMKVYVTQGTYNNIRIHHSTSHMMLFLTGLLQYYKMFLGIFASFPVGVYICAFLTNFTW